VGGRKKIRNTVGYTFIYCVDYIDFHNNEFGKQAAYYFTLPQLQV
jgi:hypothetical protein